MADLLLAYLPADFFNITLRHVFKPLSSNCTGMDIIIWICNGPTIMVRIPIYNVMLRR